MEFTVKATFNTTAEKIYNAWLTSEGHTAMTGGEAQITSQAGDTFSAWDGYISGKNLELTPFSRILQAWRTTEFEKNEADSQVEIILTEKDGTTELTLVHTNLPAHGEQYRQGWDDHYFKPMQAFFS